VSGPPVQRAAGRAHRSLGGAVSLPPAWVVFGGDRLQLRPVRLGVGWARQPGGGLAGADHARDRAGMPVGPSEQLPQHGFTGVGLRTSVHHCQVPVAAFDQFGVTEGLQVAEPVGDGAGLLASSGPWPATG
jgi:hypothetical protein